MTGNGLFILLPNRCFLSAIKKNNHVNKPEKKQDE